MQDCQLPNLIETVHFEKDGGTLSKASEKMHFFATMGLCV